MRPGQHPEGWRKNHAMATVSHAQLGQLWGGGWEEVRLPPGRSGRYPHAGESGAGSQPCSCLRCPWEPGSRLKSVFFKKQISLIFVCAGSLPKDFLWLQREGAAPQLGVGFSLWRLLLLQGTGSRAQLLRGMWDPPGQGIEPGSPALAGGFLATRPPGEPPPDASVPTGGTWH